MGLKNADMVLKRPGKDDGGCIDVATNERHCSSEL